MTHEKRLDWDEYFMQVCTMVAQRSTCERASVGAVIVKNKNILATGYNGAPRGMPHCTDVGCLVYNSTNPDGQVEENCFRTIHAEINAIAQAAKSGSSIEGSDIYITHSPCIHCLKVLINTGIGRICYGKAYKLNQIEPMVKTAGVVLKQVEAKEIPRGLTHEILLGLTAVVVFGIVAQWVAWRMRIPSILVLLLFGLAAGPLTGFLDPDHLMGDLLLPLVSLSVALILFEGGMSLKIKDLRRIGLGLTGLITVGAIVTWVLTALAAKLILGLSTPLSVLLGAILVVTGPTVVLPLLRHVRPREPVGSLVKWEGILNDPVGAVLAVLVFEAMTTGTLQAGTGAALVGLATVLGLGVGLGAVGAGVMLLLLRFYHLPEYLESPFTLMMVVLMYTVSDTFQAESGLLTVTLMGIAMANQRWVNVQHILEFKENLRVLLISSLFIFLAARLQVESLSLLGVGSFVFLAALIFVIRPVAVFASMLGTGLSVNEKLFVSWMAPRGIVAAAVSSVFALRLEEAGYAEADILVPLVFFVIMGTVVIYGLTASPVARKLGLAGGSSEGCLIVGAHKWGRAIGEALQNEGIPVLIVDNNRRRIADTKLAGLPAHHGNILDEDMPDHLPLEGIGKLLALTANHEVNSLAALHFAEVFGRQEVYQLSAKEDAEVKREEYSISQHLRGRLLFGKDLNHAALDKRFAEGGAIKTTSLSDEFDFDAFRARYGDSVLVLFVIDKGALKVAVADEALEPKPGQTVVAVIDPAMTLTPEGALPKGTGVHKGGVPS